jgi:holo-[acyl-carrier protein] synthase
MNALAHGVDIVEVSRIAEMLERHADRFRERVYTASELAAVDAKTTNNNTRLIHLAGRFAAKEAVMKALSTGWGQGVGFTDIEILAAPTGAPTVTLHNAALTHAQSLGVRSWLISISHTNTHAIASAIAIQ